MERLHETACRKLQEIKESKRSLVELKKAKKATRKREKVVVEDEMDETQTQPTTELVAEEN